MNNSMYSNRNSFNNSFSNISKINPFNPRKTAHITNNFSKKKFLIPNSNREFGKEINISSNLATNNQDIFNANKSMNINDDVVMVDENSNPNIIINNNNIENEKKININQTKNQSDEDVEMKIENESISSINNEPQKITNPQNADEYFDDICEELSKNEDKYLVDPQYMSNQSDINYRMRAILIDWLIEAHLKYKLLPQTMYIAVNLIDRYLEKNETNRAKLQLVGVTAMFIACKYEEIYPPELKDFVYITDGAYVKSDVLKMEEKMLNSLNFDITFPTQWTIFETYKRKLDLDEKTFKLAWFLMELCLINYKTLKFKMSYIAASAILIASKTMRVYSNNWFYKNIGIEEKALEECCKEMYEFYTYNATHN